jgi:hypothetical protein
MLGHYTTPPSANAKIPSADSGRQQSGQSNGAGKIPSPAVARYTEPSPRPWCSGNTSAFQADIAGSNPAGRSSTVLTLLFLPNITFSARIAICSAWQELPAFVRCTRRPDCSFLNSIGQDEHGLRLAISTLDTGIEQKEPSCEDVMIKRRSCGPVAQRQSTGLITPGSQVRILPGPPAV